MLATKESVLQTILDRERAIAESKNEEVNINRSRVQIYVAALCESFSPKLLKEGERHPFLRNTPEMSSKELLVMSHSHFKWGSLKASITGNEDHEGLKFFMAIHGADDECEFGYPLCITEEEKIWVAALVTKILGIYAALTPASEVSNERMRLTEELFRYSLPTPTGVKAFRSGFKLSDDSISFWHQLQQQHLLPHLFAENSCGGLAGWSLLGLQVGVPMERVLAPLWVREKWPELMK